MNGIAHRPSTRPRRKGFLAPAVMIALLTVLLVLAFVLDRLWLDNAHLEIATASETAALAAARQLVSDDLLRNNDSRHDPRMRRARRRARAAVAANFVVGRSLRLNDDSITFGRLVRDANTGRFRFLQTEHNPTSVVAALRRSRENGNPVALFLRGLSRRSSGDVSFRAEASIDNHVVGVRPFADVPVPMWPLAILESAPPGSKTPAWQSQIDARGGQDRFGYDEQTRRVRTGPDGIPEIVLRSAGEIRGQRSQVRGQRKRSNLCLLNLGTGFDREHIHRQFQHGVSAGDLKSRGGELRLDGGPVRLSSHHGLPAEFRSHLAAEPGCCRIVMLYAPFETADASARGRLNCTRLVAGRVMSLRLLRDGSCEIVFQPGTLTTRTALLADRNLSQSVRRRFANPYIYKLQLTY